jgi:hypothetical protein
MVVPHPASARKLLFVNREFTSHTNEMPAAKSRAVLEFLFNHIARPHWSMRFRWTHHFVAFWDNRCTRHYAIWDYWPKTVRLPNVRERHREADGCLNEPKFGLLQCGISGPSKTALDALMENCFFYISRMYEFLHRLGQKPLSRYHAY